jgi:hypothetical protein
MISCMLMTKITKQWAKEFYKTFFEYGPYHKFDGNQLKLMVSEKY